jgi:hypothetical protein
MAAQRPEALADSLAALLVDLKVTAPRKISLTGVCHTAPAIDDLAAAADSLAGRFAQALHKKGISAPVTGIDGEVVANDDGRKQTVLWGGAGREPARLSKVTVAVDALGELKVLAPVVRMPVAPRSPQSTATLSLREFAAMRGNSAMREKKSPSSPPPASITDSTSPLRHQPDHASAAPSLPIWPDKPPLVRL